MLESDTVTDLVRALLLQMVKLAKLIQRSACACIDVDLPSSKNVKLEDNLVLNLKTKYQWCKKNKKIAQALKWQ